MTIVSDIIRQLQSIHRLERAISFDAGNPVNGGSMFAVIEAVFEHIASEEVILRELSHPAVHTEWEAHRMRHTQARLGCFWVATCDGAHAPVRFDQLRAILREHARHEIIVVSALRVALGS